MKGIVLAGDSGTKLHPLTLGIPKQLIPIYDEPMIYYPIKTLVRAGISEILVITTAEQKPMFERALGDGSVLGARLKYAIQDEAKGIAQSIIIGDEFIGSDNLCLITGDTIIEGKVITDHIRKAIRTANKSGNATIFVERKTYDDQYGKVVVDKDGHAQEILGGDDVSYYYSIASLYVFPNNALKKVSSLQPSERGRIEITDLNKLFFEDGKLQVRVLENDCLWFDTNAVENIFKCSEYMRKYKTKNE